MSGSYDDTVKLWDAETGQEIKTFNGHAKAVESVHFSPDSRLIASSSDDMTIKIWDIDKDDAIQTLTGHRDFVIPVSFTPDGKHVLSGSDDGTMKMWDVAIGREVPEHIQDIQAFIWSLSISPDSIKWLSPDQETTL